MILYINVLSYLHCLGYTGTHGPILDLTLNLPTLNVSISEFKYNFLSLKCSDFIWPFNQTQHTMHTQGVSNSPTWGYGLSKPVLPFHCE